MVKGCFLGVVLVFIFSTFFLFNNVHLGYSEIEFSLWMSIISGSLLCLVIWLAFKEGEKEEAREVEKNKEIEEFLFSDQNYEVRKKIYDSLFDFKRNHGRYPTEHHDYFLNAFKDEFPNSVYILWDQYILITIVAGIHANLKNEKSFAFEFVHAFDELYYENDVRSRYFINQSWLELDENSKDRYFGTPFNVFNMAMSYFYGIDDIKENELSLREMNEIYYNSKKTNSVVEKRRKYFIAD